MLVVVAVVCGVAVAVVDVVHVVAVGNSYVSAPQSVHVVTVILCEGVRGGLALVPVALVLAVDVAVMHVVGVIAVLEGNVAATCAVDVLVVWVVMNELFLGGGAAAQCCTVLHSATQRCTFSKHFH